MKLAVIHRPHGTVLRQALPTALDPSAAMQTSREMAESPATGPQPAG